MSIEDRLVRALRIDPAATHGGKRLTTGGISFPSKNKNKKRREKSMLERINKLEMEVAELKKIVMELTGGDSNTE